MVLNPFRASGNFDQKERFPLATVVFAVDQVDTALREYR